jgi:hypothetical protein
MSNILIRNPAGKILFRGGAIAIGPNQCCSPCNCGGCSGGASPNLLVSIDASLAVGNYEGPALGCGDNPGCSCYGCALVGGSYAIAGGLLNLFAPDSCGWYGEYDAPGYQAICNGNLSDSGTYPTTVGLTILKDVTLDNHYRAYLTISFGLIAYIWFKDLGLTKPTCASIFPLTFGQYDSYQQEFFDFFGEVGEPCDLRFLDITVDVT